MKVTLGGRNVVMRRNRLATITRTASPSPEIELQDSLENMGAQMVRRCPRPRRRRRRRDDRHGSPQAIYREGIKNVTAGSTDGVGRGIDAAVKAAVESLNKLSSPSRQGHRPCRNHLGQQRRGIGKIISEAMDKVNKDGVITVEEARGLETTLEVSRACSSTAALSPYFITDADRMECILENAKGPPVRRRSPT